MRVHDSLRSRSHTSGRRSAPSFTPGLRLPTVCQLAAATCVAALALLASGSTARAAPDLIVSYADVTRASQGNYNYTVRVKNIGDTAASPFYIRITLSPSGTPKTHEFLYNYSLGPGSESGDQTGTISGTTDDHCDFKVKVDVYNTVLENNETNNDLSGDVVRLPNLVEDPTGSDPSVTRTADGEYEYQFTVCNVDECADASPTYTTDLIMDVDTVYVVSTADPLAAGACEAFGPTTATGLSDANCTWTLDIDSVGDPDGEVAEEDENDNDDATGDVDRDPDLKPINYDCSYDVVGCTAGHLFEMDVANLDECADADLSAGDGVDFKVQLFQCPDQAARSHEDEYTNHGLSTSLLAGTSQPLSYCYSLEQPCKCCRSWMDSQGEIDESDEGNNTTNDNEAILAHSSSVTTVAAISNITAFNVTVSHNIVKPDLNWTVTLNAVGGGGKAPTLITGNEDELMTVVIDPPGDVSGTVKIITTEDPTGFKQDNVFFVTPGIRVPSLSPQLLGTTGALILATGLLLLRRFGRADR